MRNLFLFSCVLFAVSLHVSVKYLSRLIFISMVNSFLYFYYLLVVKKSSHSPTNKVIYMIGTRTNILVLICKLTKTMMPLVRLNFKILEKSSQLY